MAKAEMVNAIVARGHTVVTPHPTEMVEYYRPDMLNNNATVLVKAPRQVSNAPGVEVSLPRAEYDNLLALGYVVDPNDAAAVQAARAPQGVPVAEHVNPGFSSSQRH